MFALVVIVLIVIAGIGYGLYATNSGGVTTTTVTQTSSASSSVTTTSSSGTSSIGNTIKIGLVVPLTGVQGSLGLSTYRGVELAVSQINAKGGVDGMQLSLVYYDDASDASQEPAIAQKLIQSDDVSVIIEGAGTPQTLALEPVAQAAGIPVVVTWAGHPNITSQYNDAYRIAMSTSTTAFTLTQFAVDSLHGHKLALLVGDNSYDVSVAQFIVARAQQLGVSVVYNEQYPTFTQTDFRAYLSSIESSGADVLMPLSFDSGTDGAIASQAQEVGLTIPSIGVDSRDTVQYLNVAGSAANGTYFSSTYSGDENSSVALNFIANYTALNGPADEFAAEGYDSVLVIAQGIQIAHQTGPVTASSLLTAIGSVKNLQLVTGEMIGFTQTPVRGEIIRPTLIEQWVNGKIEVVATYTSLSVIQAQS